MIGTPWDEKVIIDGINICDKNKLWVEMWTVLTPEVECGTQKMKTRSMIEISMLDSVKKLKILFESEVRGNKEKGQESISATKLIKDQDGKFGRKQLMGLDTDKYMGIYSVYNFK